MKNDGSKIVQGFGGIVTKSDKKWPEQDCRSFG
jgi:hypothetical protein